MKSNLQILREFSDDCPVDVFKAAAAIGVRVVFDKLPDGISGKIQKDQNGKYYIVANILEPKVRQRFIVAHELGHYIYHRDLIGDGVSDSPAYRAPDESVYDNTPLERIHEQQANQFAANFLMPMNLVRKYRYDNAGTSRSPSELARIFDVSESSMRVRLGLPRE